MVEFFAGKGNLSLAMRASGFRVASLDLLYPVANSESHGSNCMDILSCSGFWCLVCANSPEWCFCLIFVFFYQGNRGSWDLSAFSTPKPKNIYSERPVGY